MSIDVNAAAEKTLNRIFCTLTYAYPRDFKVLPTISWYVLHESNDFSSDNTPDIRVGRIQVDVWARLPSECTKLGAEVEMELCRDGWAFEMARDIAPDGAVYHRTMRFCKDFLL